MDATTEINNLLAKIRNLANQDPRIVRATHAIEFLVRGNMPVVDHGAWADIYMSPSEARVMSSLFARPGRLMTKDKIMDSLYYDRPGDEPDSGTKIVDVFICKLRERLKGTKFRIETIHWQGYKGVITEPSAAALTQLKAA